MKSDRVQHRYYGPAVYVLSFIIYAATCCRTVYIGDSGELTLTLVTGGIAHPPGYPLYTILGFLWLKIFFFLSPALAANLFSAAISAGSVTILYYLLRRLGSKRMPPYLCAAVALAYALAHPVWSSATNAEVYALSGLLYLAALYAVVVFYFRPTGKSLITAAFLFGLILTHHFSAGVVVTALILAVVFHRSEVSSRTLFPAVLAGILPLTLYLYLYFRLDPNLPVNWMLEKSFSAVWGMISADIYRQFVGLPTVLDFFLYLKKTAIYMISFLGPGVVLVAMPGLIISFRKRLELNLLIVVPAVFNICLVSTYHIPDYEGYLIPLTVTAVVLIFIFVDWLWQRGRHTRTASMALAGLIVILAFAGNITRTNLASFTLGERYGRDILDSAGPNATILLKSDNASHTALYLRYVEEYRDDLDVYSTTSTLARMQATYGPADYIELAARLEAEPKRLYWGAEYIINQGLNPSGGDITLRGMLYARMGDDDDTTVTRRIISFTRDVLPQIGLNDDLKARQVYLEYRLHDFDRIIRAGLGQTLTTEFDDLYAWGEQVDDPMTCLAVAQFFRSRGIIDQALNWIDLARRTEPYSYEMKDLYVNLGIVYRQAGDLPQAQQALIEALNIDAAYTPALYNARLIEAEQAVRSQDWYTAIASFKILNDMEPDNPLPYYNIGLIYETRLNRADLAIDFYRKFLMLAKNQDPRLIDRVRERIQNIQSPPDSLK